MAKNTFPPTGQNYKYLQTNRSDDLGSLWATTGIDFQSNLGMMLLGSKLRINTNTNDDSSLGLPYAFKAFDGRVFALCGMKVFKNTGNDIISPFSADTSTGFVTTYSPDFSDMEVYNNVLVTAVANRIYSKASNGSGTGAWTDRGAISSSYHTMRYFKKFNKLYFADASNRISSMNPDFSLNLTGDYTINLDNSVGQMTKIETTSERIWIGTVRIYNSASGVNTIEKAVMLEWDGISQQITREYPIDAQGILAITIKDDIPWIMDSNGVLRKYTGSSFEEVGRLPLVKELLVQSTYSLQERFIHPNGLITTKDDTIKALINNRLGDNASSVKENIPSGIWEWSQDIGFTHRNLFTYQRIGSLTITDYGQSRISQIGALANANIYSNAAGGRGTIICGATYYTDATTTATGIFIDSPIPVNTVSTPEGLKKGSYITTWFDSAEVEDKWSRIWAVYRRFVDAGESIVFKYRLYEEDPIQATITWVSTTSFTTTTNITAYGPTATGFNGTQGGEVEILNGTGGNSCAHIISIVNNSGTYTVTLDTPITGVTTGTAIVRFQKWIKLNPTIMGLVKSWEQLAIGKNNTRIQIKCCLTLYGNGEFQKFILTSNEDIEAKL